MIELTNLMNNDESTDIRELIQNSEDNLVELSTGEKLFGDFLEFLEFVDFFASRYGLGGHKSIEEYAEMINQTDPVLLHGLRDAGVRAENRKWGAEDDSDSSDFKDGKQDIHTATGDNDKNAFDSGKKPNLSTIDGKGGLDLRNMLLEFGVDKGELNKATEKQISSITDSWEADETLEAYIDKLNQNQNQNSK